MTAPEMLAALERLEPYGPEFRGFLSNHGPMVAESLLELDAAGAIGPWVARYLEHLEPAPPLSPPIPQSAWPTALGDPALAGEWLATVVADAHDNDWRGLLARWWPRLLPGLAAAAAHGVIRVAHAVRQLDLASGDPSPLLLNELQRGLAYWASRYQEVPSAGAIAGDLGAVAAVAALPRLALADRPSGVPGIAPWLDALAGVPRYVEALECWAAPSDPDIALDEIVEASARVLAAREDTPIAFCHAVTAPSAVRLVLPHLPSELHHATVAATWSTSAGLIAAFAHAPTADESAPTLLTDGTSPTQQRQRLTAQAVAHGDEHVIKLTAAALREHTRTGAPTLLAAAERLMSRLTPTTS